MMDQAMAVALAAVLVAAIGTDLHSSRIPNWLTFSTMGFALLGHTWTYGTSGTLFSMAGLGVGLALFVIPYAAGGMGAGDVKLMAAIGALLGPEGALLSGLLAIMIGGVYAVGAMCYQLGLIDAGRKLLCAAQAGILTGGRGWAENLQLPFRLRYGVAIAGGALLYELGLHPFWS